MQSYQNLFRIVMENVANEKIVIYTDGSCLGNPGAGGYAAIIYKGLDEVILKGGEPDTTNNRMEMKAILEALKWIALNGEGRDTEIYSDSSLVLNSITKGWKRKANLDLWGELDKALHDVSDVKIGWHWVKGHSDNEYNAKADEVAVKESKKQPQGKAKVPVKNGDLYHCNNCGKDTKGVLSLLPDSGMIRTDCENCGSYIMFAENNGENKERAERRVLISKAQLEKVVEIKEKRGEPVSENQLKKIKTWPKEQAEEFIEGDQTLF